mmetsp:Transcript_79891/g.191864  ORF Transcript_79891/g.191864 Transcript_79891/m.191864 type:complete len:213 (+) Transcript_79891:895-1533(+)
MLHQLQCGLLVVRRRVGLHPGDQRGVGGHHPEVVAGLRGLRPRHARLGRGEHGPIPARLALRWRHPPCQVQPHRAHVACRLGPSDVVEVQAAPPHRQLGQSGRHLVRRVQRQVPRWHPGSEPQRHRSNAAHPGPPVQTVRPLPAQIPYALPGWGCAAGQSFPLAAEGHGPMHDQALQRSWLGQVHRKNDPLPLGQHVAPRISSPRRFRFSSV